MTTQFGPRTGFRGEGRHSSSQGSHDSKARSYLAIAGIDGGGQMKP